MNVCEIGELIPSIAYAHLLYEYGKLEKFIAMGNDEPCDDQSSVFYDGLSLAADFIYNDYMEEYNGDKWYFSSESMVTYYRLCRVYGSAHRMKLADNPYLREARNFVENAMDMDCQGGYGWTLQTKINHAWASGLVFQTDESFRGEFELLEALLELQAWYADAVYRLRKKALEERILWLPALPAPREVSAA